MPNVTLTPNVNTDLYASTGITPGAQIRVSTIATADVRLSTSSAGLVNDYIVLAPYEQAINNSGDPGAWAVSKGPGGAVNVTEV